METVTQLMSILAGTLVLALLIGVCMRPVVLFILGERTHTAWTISTRYRIHVKHPDCYMPHFIDVNAVDRAQACADYQQENPEHVIIGCWSMVQESPNHHH